MDEEFDNKMDKKIEIPNDITGLEPVDNKDEPDPIENVLVLDKEPDYNNDKPPAHPPMGMAMTWATDEEIQEMLKKHREEMERLDEEAKLVPGLDLGPVKGLDIPEQGPDIKGLEFPEQGPDDIGGDIPEQDPDIKGGEIELPSNIITDPKDPNYYSQYSHLVDPGVDIDINHAKQTLLNLKNKLLEEDALDREAEGLALHR